MIIRHIKLPVTLGNDIPPLQISTFLVDILSKGVWANPSILHTILPSPIVTSHPQIIELISGQPSTPQSIFLISTYKLSEIDI